MAARFNQIKGIAVDAGGNIFVTDYGSRRVRKINTSGIVSNVLQYSTANRPWGIAVDGSGTLYITYPDENIVRQFVPNTTPPTFGIVSNILGNGAQLDPILDEGNSATSCAINAPKGIVVDASGDIYVIGEFDYVLKVHGGIMHLISGRNWSPAASGDGGPANWGRTYLPSCIAIDLSGNIYVNEASPYNDIRVLISCSPLSVSPISALSSLCVGATVTLTNSTGGGTWSSTNPSIATIDSNGVTIALTQGIATISYTVTNSCGPSSVTADITIIAPPSAGTITGASSVCTGVVTSLGETGPTDGSWSSNNPAIASVSASGYVGGASVGSVIISYSVNNACGTAHATKSMTVNQSPDAGLISGASSVCIGSVTTLSNTSPGGIWSSGNTSVVIVNANGGVTGVSAGTSFVSYSVSSATCGSRHSTHSIAVYPDAGAITGISQVAIAHTTTLSPTIGGGTWSSGNPSLATVSPTGIVTGIAYGFTTISYAVTGSCGTAYAQFGIAITNHKPYFDIGHPAQIAVCSAPGTFSMNGGLKASDPDSGQVLTWGLYSSPHHGSATIASATICTGGAVSPVSTSYAVDSAYTGTDSFTVSLTDGIDTVFLPVHVTIKPSPALPTITGPSDVCIAHPASFTGLPAGGLFTKAAGNINCSSTGIVTGTHTGSSKIQYMVTDTNNCSNRAYYDLAIISTIGPNSISGSTSFLCPGSTVHYTHSDTTGAWTTSNSSIANVNHGTVTAITAGIDTVYYTVTNVCGVNSARRIVNVMPLPDAGSLSGPSSVTAGSYVSLAHSGSAGIWSSNNMSLATVSNSGRVRGVAPGTDSIKYTVTNSCGSASTAKFITILAPKEGEVLDSSAVAESTISLKVYPNPTDGAATIELMDYSGPCGISIVDMNGKEVYRASGDENKINIDLGNIPKGMYLIRIEAGENKFNEKIIIK